VKTDTIFYRLFQSFPSILFELINRVPEEASIYQFLSVKVKQLAFRIDGVFLPRADAPEQPIYFTEVQFQADPQLYSRFFAEIFLYLNKTELTNDWRGAILFPSRNVDVGATERYRELLSSRRVSRIYLDELGEIGEQSLGISIEGRPAGSPLLIVDEQTAIEQGRELSVQFAINNSQLTIIVANCELSIVNCLVRR